MIPLTSASPSPTLCRMAGHGQLIGERLLYCALFEVTVTQADSCPRQENQRSRQDQSEKSLFQRQHFTLTR